MPSNITLYNAAIRDIYFEMTEKEKASGVEAVTKLLKQRCTDLIKRKGRSQLSKFDITRIESFVAVQHL